MLVAALGSSCSSTSVPAPRPLTATSLVNANAGDGSTYTLGGPLSQVTSVYGILRVAGQGAVTITAISANVSTSQESHWECAIGHSTIATVHGDLQQATALSFQGGGDLQSMLQRFTPRLVPWDDAVAVSHATLRAGPLYLLATVFDIPHGPSWGLLGADITYRVGSGPFRTLALRNLSVRVQTPLASP